MSNGVNGHHPTVLTIAGFDPSAGAGVAADLKTIAAHNGRGVAAITALTVQNTQGVKRIEAVSHKLLEETLDALARYLAPGEIVELIMAIGFWGMVARILETTEVDLEEFAGKVNLLEGRKPMD